jgi:hypothetical protein
MWTGSSVDTRGMWVNTTPGPTSKVPPPRAPQIAMAAYPGFERENPYNAIHQNATFTFKRHDDK